MLKLTDFIIEIPDLIPAEERIEVMDLVKSVTWEDATVSHNNTNKDVRNCMTASSWGTELDPLFFTYASKAIDYYHSRFPRLSISRDTGYDILKYEPGGFYTQHVDSYNLRPRIMSLSITLNSNFEGGGWSFFDGEYTLPSKAGCGVMFPSNFMYPHAITPVTKGTRYSMLTWFI